MGKILEVDDKLNDKFAKIYKVELLFEEKNEEPDIVNILHKLNRKLGNVEIVSETGLISFAFRDYSVRLEKGELPAQVICSEYTDFDKEKISELIRSQCWDCTNIDDLLDKCKYKMMISDFMSYKLDYKERTNLIKTFLDVILNFFPNCIAIYWPHSEKIMPIEVYKDNPYMGNITFLHGGLNVRYFNMSSSKSMVLDTVGLYAIGLSDFQCHFKNVDPNDIIPIMYDLAAYIFENGDTIEDGNTIGGIKPEEKWICHRRKAIVPPHRPIIDINIGENSVK